MGGHGRGVLKRVMAWLAPTCTTSRGWYLSITKVMKGLMTSFATVQSCEHHVLDNSSIRISVLFPAS